MPNHMIWLDDVDLDVAEFHIVDLTFLRSGKSAKHSLKALGNCMLSV